MLCRLSGGCEEGLGGGMEGCEWLGKVSESVDPVSVVTLLQLRAA